MKYCVFETNWGYFSLGGTAKELCLTKLPGLDADELESLLLRDLAAIERVLGRSAGGSRSDPEIESDLSYFKPLQEQIAAYFGGEVVVFGDDIPVNFGLMSDFGRAVLGACRQVGFGRTITYSGLARRIGNPKASRAVGGAMAANPMPLIIPCHRVLRSDGELGGFSAPGGVAIKKRLLEHEQCCVRAVSAGQRSWASTDGR